MSCTAQGKAMGNRCPKCDTDNPSDSKFCKECASPLKPLEGVSVTKTILSPTIASGKTLTGKYKIQKEIGRGGMGVVFKATDTKLKRNVALKFLPAELMQDKKAKARFVQEAQAAAALNHPNICVIYEVDESGDQTFIAMEYIEGQTLKDKIVESGPLAIDDAIKITTQVAEGLAEAHSKGIVHRDIKPANIMLTDKGSAKIMDFGIAKLKAGEDLTKTSTLIGTVAYMSPEQAKGDEVDHRSDIWSLGAMFYEMLTGELPFQKSQEQALIYAILNDKPTPLSLLLSEIPSYIELVIEKALAKKTSERYENIHELISALESRLSIDLPKSSCSIVVLPFNDMSPNKDNEYFSDGLTEEIITDLSQVHELCVISRNSAMALKGTNKKTKTIGEELSVQYVLEGSVRKAGQDLRITAQLVDVRTDVHLWAEKYKGKLDDVFEIQEKVSRSIVDALKLKLSPEENKKITERPIDNFKAYDCFLRARQEILHLSEEGLQRALHLIQTGLDIIGENEILYASLGYVYVQFVNVGISIDEKFLNEAEKNVNKVFSINPDSALAHSVMGQIHWKRGEIQEAIIDLKKALAIEPNSPEGLYWLAWIYEFSGKMEAARILLERLIEIDPLTGVNYLLLGNCDFFSGKFEASIQYFVKAFEIDSKNPLFRFILALVYAAAQKHKEAFEVIDLMTKDMPQELFTELGQFYKYALQNNTSKNMFTISDKLKSYAARDEVISLFVAECYALLNEKEEAINWVEYGVGWGFINYPYLSEYDPFLENIRGEPRFKKLMERVKREWEDFEA